MLFKRKNDENYKNAFLAKPLKISIFPRENWYFQGIEDNKNEKHMIKNLEKIDAFWNIDLEGILGRFWKGFRRPKSLIFTLFSMFFRSHFWSTLGKGKKSTQEAQQDGSCAFLPLDSGGPGSAGERQREGIKNLGLHNELSLSNSRSVMGKWVSESDLFMIQHASHTFGGRRIEDPLLFLAVVVEFLTLGVLGVPGVLVVYVFKWGILAIRGRRSMTRQLLIFLGASARPTWKRSLEGCLEWVLEGHLRGSMPKNLQTYQKIVARPCKIEPWGLQNRAWSPPRRYL